MSFERACAISDVPTDEALGVTIGAYDVAVAGHDGEYFAVQDLCSHAEVPLSDGDIDGCTLECYMHGSRFDLRTGEPRELPATEPVPVYPVRIDGTDIYVDIDNPINQEH